MEEQHIQDIGTVVAVRENHVRVEIERSASCGSCSLRHMCFGQNTPAIFDLETDLELVEGDRVQLYISPGTRGFSAIMVFAVPLLFLFGGFIISRMWLDELPAIGIAFAATALGFFIIRLVDRKIGVNLNVRIGSKI